MIAFKNMKFHNEVSQRAKREGKTLEQVIIETSSILDDDPFGEVQKHIEETREIHKLVVNTKEHESIHMLYEYIWAILAKMEAGTFTSGKVVETLKGFLESNYTEEYEGD